ncbi:AraC family transcriptional regulator [Streptomyces sp. NBC_00199]|uniref:AraC family transcriptional regulator n=1 Tax=Streptomyces sp. NBC_00199 TaxID=2975678 RepID=UPI00224EAE2A|nr:AraC family transcriptional regulator [Streptomyces sp. NBC_00199]MCX5268720.1 helix-turn-helix transcriptional regulator [Streptomyces sp. NBC_00199]
MPTGDDACAFVNLPWPAGGDDRHLYLGVNLSDRTLPLGPGSPHVLSPGDLVVLGTVPPGGDLAEEVAFFRVPRFLLDVPEEALRCARVIRVSGSDGLAECVSLFLSALARTSRSRASALGSRLALNTADLVALLLSDVQGTDGAGDPADPAHDLLRRVQTHIQENLADSSMSPDSIARAHHISVRYLHKLFRTSGTTVGAWIRQHRLAACRLELRRQRRSVAVVAQSWGFTSPSHFSRVFRQTYGLSPKQWQNSVL